MQLVEQPGQFVGGLLHEAFAAACDAGPQGVRAPLGDMVAVGGERLADLLLPGGPSRFQVCAGGGDGGRREGQTGLYVLDGALISGTTGACNPW
ncbi:MULTISPECIES: hypothetical protein [unclassified Streptomyces]|uniref:hypothetical protein n=1 Tax=unclassified Streptomyces TaxID=2593676 RepID=UPI00224EE5F8|nr:MULTISPECIES: hypothetical protein [unclassified Streptomyces]WSP53416.1 hypothetical protein OG306_02610 [Streptomyces sp. NBC_01241]WSU25912.1 hypothetical protein OG508_36745 [Streptomyces sp. NBC_01108]MCX4784786.1 hypothetical protein [Streptomyces sp. NBC_01221]MCX4799256.1 hypothetical protein [Streptomyces sp. NBC_01242]WSJ40439.1 hypothetical protein OG772_33690 [Streptomyces sp. NBC_01321]